MTFAPAQARRYHAADDAAAISSALLNTPGKLIFASPPQLMLITAPASCLAPLAWRPFSLQRRHAREGRTRSKMRHAISLSMPRCSHRLMLAPFQRYTTNARLLYALYRDTLWVYA